ncbi:hypothetical protein V1478_003269 [Vespula squamosa]|uniref:Uncharacterized protein n=1 Tax=Vespula squamosa TaxID=30214 RepID=A0ABD2BSQ5_VESSQ
MLQRTEKFIGDLERFTSISMCPLQLQFMLREEQSVFRNLLFIIEMSLARCSLFLMSPRS